MVQITLKLSVAEVFVMVKLQGKNKNCSTVKQNFDLSHLQYSRNWNFAQQFIKADNFLWVSIAYFDIPSLLRKSLPCHIGSFKGLL